MRGGGSAAAEPPTHAHAAFTLQPLLLKHSPAGEAKPSQRGVGVAEQSEATTLPLYSLARWKRLARSLRNASELCERANNSSLIVKLFRS